MRGRNLAAEPCGAVRNHRETEARDEDPLVEEHLAHPDRVRRLADDDRHDRRLAFERLESGADQRGAEMARVLVQRADPLRMRLDETHRRQGAGGDSRRQRVRKKLGTRALCEHVAQRCRPRDEPPRRTAERLAERRGDDIDFAEHSEMLRRTASGRADHARRVRVVDDQHRVVIARDLEQLGKLRDAPFHREDSVGPDQPAFRTLVRLQFGDEVIEVAVRIHGRRALGDRFREANRVDDRRMIQRVGADEVALFDDRRREPFVRIPRGDERHR